MKKRYSSESAFFYPRVLFGALFCFVGVALALFGLRSALAQGQSPKTPVVRGVYRGLSPVVKFDISPPLRDMKIIPPGPGQLRENEDREIVPLKIRFAPEWDPVVQTTVGGGKGLPNGTEIGGPIVSFNAQPNGSGVAPPDANGAVGPNHIVAMANLSFQIFNKTGTSLFGPALNNTLWAGFGGSCQTSNSGDPVVLYDRAADRWLLSQFTAGAAPFLNCVAISQTNDPTGAYYRYAFQTGTTGANFPDYPKYGVWPDAYYISTREFLGTGGAFQGVGAYALNRAQMLVGNPVPQVISFLVPPSPAYVVGDGLLPSDLDGSTPPPVGSPNYFVGSQDNNGPYGAPSDALNLFKFHVDFATPANSTFALTNTIPVAAFNSILGLCGGTRACIPQPGTTNRIDHLGYRQRPLFRLAYRNFGTHESLVTNQSVSGGTGPGGEVSGIRWWELRSPNGAPFIYQEGTYAPGVTDGIHRWMGSIAMNGAGSMAMGYSSASATVFPSVSYTGRLAGDPLGVMPQGEGTIIAGTGSQTAGGNRWGDYTSLSVDPNDDLTFWHVNEWVPTTSASGWQLRVGSFKVSTVPENSIVSGGSYIVSAGSNGVLDPGEIVTVALGLRDVNAGAPGVACTTALSGTLQGSGGVTMPPGAQGYGAPCTSDPVVFRYFTFTVDPALPCGSTVTASLAVVDGATNYGTFTYAFPTGITLSSNLENFDGVVAPALPAGWTATASGSGVLPTTVTTFPDTAPNAVFLSEAATVGLSEVASAAVAVTGGAKLSFRNEFNTESGFDGLVLEISIPTVAGGAFQDILTAGGSFASGGYNSTLSTGFSNPLPGRMAWSGLSGGTAAAPSYITTVVNLPAAAAGQMVQFKWRQGSDSSVMPATNPGSRIDSITLFSTACNGSAPTGSAVSRKTHTGVGDFDVSLPLVAVNGAVGIEPRNGPAHTVLVTFPSPVTVGSAAVTAGTGTASASVVGNVVTVNLTGVADAQRLAVTLSNVSDGVNVGNIIVPIGVLSGDTNGSGGVTSTDVTQTKAAVSAGVLSGANFRTDVNVSGTLTSSDIAIVKSKSGAVLPP